MHAGKTPQVRRWLVSTAWLAVVALLLAGLLPVALAVAAVPGPQAPGNAFCGSPGRPGQDQTPATAPRHHCVFCLITAGAAPAAPTRLIRSSVARLAALMPPRRDPPRRNIAFAVAQPRGPPVTG